MINQSRAISYLYKKIIPIYMKNKIFTILFCLTCISSFSQTVEGNVNSNMTLANLGYANVDIYRNGILVANVLTDDRGNFNVKLDTGTYKCVINYAGYEKQTKEIRVVKDEKVNFGLDADAKSDYYGYAPEITTGSTGIMLTSEREGKGKKFRGTGEKTEELIYHDLYTTTYEGKSDGTYSWGFGGVGTTASTVWGSKVPNSDSASYGKLTAGEINDFAKWELWKDLAEGELKNYQGEWDFSPTDRYVLQLKDQNGLPLANAVVELFDGSDILYTSRTDNTGKAELWGKLKFTDEMKTDASAITVKYKGQSKTVNKPKKISRGINNVEMNVKCEQSQNVEIAMVVDATGSMQDEIDYLKMDLNDVIFKAKGFSSSLNLSFANVFYKDNSDDYVVQSQDFTRILSESVAYTNNHNAGGGGDTPEAVEVAMEKAINGLSWSDDTRTKIMFLVLDAPPHNTPEIRNKIMALCYKAAEKGIRIVPIAASGADKSTEYLMRCIALATNGTYVFISDHSGIGGSHTAPSTDSYTIELLNDLLVRIMKAYTYMPDCNQQIADLGVELPDSQVTVIREVDSLTIDTTKTTHLQNDSIQLEWSFYPNPTTGIVNIKSNMEIRELYITDLSGKAIQIVNDIQAGRIVTVDLSEYASGIYLIRYPLGKTWISGKIILARN
jgi:hypothetical protein